MTIPENWLKMTPDERMGYRFEKWRLAEDKSFESAAAKERYQRRVQRVIDVIQLRKPDRVPCFTKFGGFIADYAGITHQDMMYDYEKAATAILRTHIDFQPDYYDLGYFLPGETMELLDYRVYRWPGQKLAANVPFQCVESEYMTAEEYDALIDDPERFYMQTYMPRVFPELEGWRKLGSFYTSCEIPGMGPMFGPAGTPEVIAAFEAYLEAGRAAQKWSNTRKQVTAELIGQQGMPYERGAFSKAPFDILGDTMRGTRGIMLDMYRQPEKLVTACERLIPIAIQMGVEGANATGIPLVFMPLHKGADGFMSKEAFQKFYWPSFKAVMEGLIAEGLVPNPFVEGGFNKNERLDIIADSGLPAGKTYWLFDRTEITVVKEKFGGWAAFGGNVPASLYHSGTPQEMTEAVRTLIETVGQDGGYFLSPGAVLDHVRPENMRAYISAAREYGVH
jgi:hypothetical protein